MTGTAPVVSTAPSARAPGARANALMALAIIKSNADRPGATYLDYFLPFVADALRAAPTDIATTDQVRGHLATAFGLTVPLPVVRTLLKRAARRGYATARDGTFARRREKLDELDFQGTRQSVLRQQSQLVDALIEFAAERYNVVWTPEIAERNLLASVIDKSTDVLAASLNGARFGEEGLAPGDEYIVHRFILYCSTSNQVLFQCIESIAKGNMLADALYYPIDEVQRRPKHLIVYLDTTLVIRALGLNVPAVVESAREVLNLARAQNCELRVFDHTETEVTEVLDAVGRALRRASTQRIPHGETLNYCLDAGVGASDIELVIQRLPERLLALGIHSYAAPKHREDLGVDEQKLRSYLDERIVYRREEALYRDIDSLTAVYRLRRGQLYSRLEDAGHVFVTTNSALAQVSGQFFKDEYGRYSAPPCILDHIFATLMWLKEPLSAPSLPRKLVIADCYAAMNPTDALWRKYLAHVEQLRHNRVLSDEDYHLLRYGHESRELLLDFTRSDVTALTEGTPLEILQAAKARMREEGEAQLRNSRTEAEGRVAAEKAARLAAEQRAREAEDVVRAERAKQRLAFRRQARLASYLLLTPPLALATAALALGAAYGLPGIVPRVSPYAAFGLSAALAVASFVNLYVGGSVRALVDTWFVALAVKLERRFTPADASNEVTAAIQLPPRRLWVFLVLAAPLLGASSLATFRFPPAVNVDSRPTRAEDRPNGGPQSAPAERRAQPGAAK